MAQKRNEPSIIQLMLTAGSVLVMLLYLGIALNTEDAIWFWRPFVEQPYEIIVHCYGEDSVMRPGTPDHDALTAMFNEQISGTKNWDSITMSDDTYDYYQTSDAVLSVELHYSPAVRIHSVYKFFGSVDTLVMPLVGRHSKTNAIFGQTRGVSTAGSFHVQTTQPLLDYVTNEGLCTK